MNDIIVSLLLTTYNSEKNLPLTLASIENQDYHNIEVVIKDGGSADTTLDIIKQYADTSKNKVIWESKQDAGLYDAMNQAFKMSSGDVIAVFNDQYTDNGAISKYVEAIQSNDDVVGAHSDLVYASEGKIVRKWHMGNSGAIHFGWMPGHPTLYLKRSVYEMYGLYDTSYESSSDYEFMIRFLKDGNKLAYVPEVLISMFHGGDSTSTSSLKGYIRSFKEGHRALASNGVKMAFVADISRTVRVIFQFLIKR